MAHNWDSSKRRADTPAFRRLRALVIERDQGRCQEYLRDGIQCPDRGTECDHIINLASGGTDTIENLRMLCEWHHKKKTAQEARDARTYLTTRRPKEAHPGWN